MCIRDRCESSDNPTSGTVEEVDEGATAATGEVVSGPSAPVRSEEPDPPHAARKMGSTRSRRARGRRTVSGRMASTLWVRQQDVDGGEGGIRTLETVARLHDFQSCSLSRLGHLSAVMILEIMTAERCPS